MTQDKQESSGALSGFFGKLRDVVFEESPPDAVVAKGAAVPAMPAASVGRPAGVASVPSAPASEDNPMVGTVMQVVLDKPTAYTALLEAISPLEQFIPDEGSRYKAAFGIVGKTRTIEQIVQAIDMQHMQVLNEQINNFSSQARTEEGREIDSRMADIASLKAKVKSQGEEVDRTRQQLEARLLSLGQDIEAKTEEIKTMEQEVSEKREQIVRVNKQFSEAAEAVKNQLVQAKAKVLRYLSA